YDPDADPATHRRSLSKNEMEMGLREDVMPPRQFLQQEIDAILNGDRVTVFSFIEQLELVGITAMPNVASTGRMNGFSYEYEGVAFKSSQLGKSYSWAQLAARGVDYEQNRDGEELAREAQRLRAGVDSVNERDPGTDGPGQGEPQGGAGGLAPAGVVSGAGGIDKGAEPHAGGTAGAPEGHGAAEPADRQPDNAGGSDSITTLGSGNELSSPDRGGSGDPQERDGGQERRTPGHGHWIDRFLQVGDAETTANNPEPEAQSGRIQSDRGYAGVENADLQDSEIRQDREPISNRNQETAPANDLENARNNIGTELSDWNTAADRIADLAAESRVYQFALSTQPEIQRRPDEIAKRTAWMEQHNALMAPQYRVTLVPRKGNKPPYVLGKTKNQSERFYSPQEMLDLIPTLREKNAIGHDIYITPIDDRTHYILIDDVRTRSLEAIKVAGLQPAVIQKTSRDNHQLIFKVPKENRPDEQAIANELTMKLNRQFGDKNLSGAVHPFRMAGFSNKKPERKNHLTLILDAANRVCDVAKNMLAGLRRQYDEMAIRGEQERRTRWIEQQSNNTGDIQAEFRLAYKKHLALAAKLGWEQNGSALDWQVVLELIEKKYSASDIKRTLIECSPNVIARHSNVDEYADRTITKAMSEHRKAEPAAPAERAKRVQRDRDDGQSYGR
ncbi:DNA-primase RepB domain-containing protein, partial [Aeromonas caviae]|uniref:DNA-primase RepB domain-containing protein n=1 Tax=Aeromonas caviae TaxID=648 RepID=UPI0038CF47F4